MAINETFDVGNHSNLRGDDAPSQLSAAIVNIRAIDGANNNLTNPSFNATNTDFARITPAHFTDGVSGMEPGPNPRAISNIVVGQGDADVPDPSGYSGFMYAWGQFIDHDLDLEKGGTVDATIVGPDGTVIPLSRVSTDPNATPATAINTITGWLDGSMVYGSDSVTAASLRNANGTMKTSAGGNLPIVNGQFAAGDVRAQENPDLTALQTLFVREHNFQVHQLAQAHKDWTGDQLYAQARAIVGAEIANITYSEFLPHLLGSAAPGTYQGFNPNVDPRISEEFEGAAYRFGHSLVSGDIEAIDNNGNVTSSQALKDVFFEPPAAFAATGADGLLRHLASDTSNAMDARLIPDLRNFLNDPPAVTDLASINIQRGRDLGFGTLNQTRVALGLPAYTDFAQITDDQGTVDALRQAYGDVNAIDLWTGGLAEKRVDGGMLGQTFTDIVADQFERLRDGDRFYFENQGFDPPTLADIKSTTLSDIILRDTDTKAMQPDAFVGFDHEGLSLGQFKQAIATAFPQAVDSITVQTATPADELAKLATPI